MKVLLLQDLERVGKQGEVVTVRDGYARNFLIPRRLATLPRSGAEKELALIRRKQQKIEQEFISKAEEVQKAIEGIPEITLELRANEEGALFGSVTPSMVATALKDHKVKIDGKQVEIESPIKEVGDFEVRVLIYKEVAARLKIKVKATEEVKAETPEAEPEEAPAPAAEAEPQPES